MIPMFRRLWYRLRYDELAVQRWSRALLMGLATGGIAFGDQLAAVLGSEVKSIKIAAVIAGFLSLMVTAGEKNEKPTEPQP